MEGGANSESMRMSLLNDEPLSEHDEGRSTSRPAPRQTLTTTGRDYVEARQTMSGTGSWPGAGRSLWPQSRAGQVDCDTTSEGIRRRTQAAIDSSVVNRITRRQTITTEEAAAPQHLTGLSHADAEWLLQEHGPNFNPAKLSDVYAEAGCGPNSISRMIFKQFIGVLPIYMVLCVIICGIAVDLIDAILILVLLLTNAYVRSKEEHKAYNETQALKASHPQTCRCIREGTLVETTFETDDGPKTIGMLTELLVPGDVISIRTGDIIPADCAIIEGSIKMDVGRFIGDGYPHWKVPRPTPAEAGRYAENEKGKEMWGTCAVVQGECVARVIRTGVNTIWGEISAELAKTGPSRNARKSDFEEKILLTLKLIISIAFGIGVIMFLVVYLAYQLPYAIALKAWVAVLMGSIPISLPLVLQVAVSVGVVTMARERAVVSDPAALSDIASVTVLNVDKTGTLTTAVMEIDFDRIHAEPGFTKMEILELAVVCSNRKNKDDAIDGAIIRKYDLKNGGEEAGAKLISDKWKVKGVKGFNNAAKRIQCTAVCNGVETVVVKGLPPKVLKNDEKNAEDEDNSHTRFEAKGYAENKDRVIAIVHAFEDAGLKTIGVSVNKGECFEFAGILPMMDPARPDASMCVKMLMEAGIEVKMITGDAVNIAKTTAGDIGIGTNILPNTALQDLQGAQLHKCILESNGFAQVMPKDKETIVLEERAEGWIVGLCGDGTSDALALNYAHVGIAVADASDAVVKASAIQLLDPGLQCIFTAVVESRKMFRRIKAYVVFRLAATIQMIMTLSVLTFVSGCNIDLIYVVLLVFFNDLSMIMVSRDNQKASRLPDRPNVMKILAQACCFGLFQLVMTLIFFYVFNDPNTNIMANVKDSYHIEPVTWLNYQQSRKGYGNDDNLYPQSSVSDRVNKYQMCMQTICPEYRCGLHSLDGTGGLVKNKHCSQSSSTVASATCTTMWTTGCQDLYINGNESATCAPAATGTESWKTTNDLTVKLTPSQVFTKDQIGRKPFCPDKFYTPSDLPQWQECCVQFADLQHPGKANYGSYDNYCTESTTIFMFLQLLVASEFMVFPVRALSWMWTSQPAWSVTIPVFVTVIVLSCLAAAGIPDSAGPLGVIFVQKAGWKNLGICAAWGVLATFLLDAISVAWVNVVDGSTEEIEYERVRDRMDAEGLKY